jgi:hypothetical protein
MKVRGQMELRDETAPTHGRCGVANGFRFRTEASTSGTDLESHIHREEMHMRYMTRSFLAGIAIAALAASTIGWA